MNDPVMLLKSFELAIGRELFYFQSSTIDPESANEYKLRADWFNQYAPNSFVSWLVSHLEARIFLAWQTKDESYFSDKNPLTDREIYADVWCKMPETEREKHVWRAINKVHNYNESCFINNTDNDSHELRAEVMRKLTPEDRVLKQVLVFNQLNVPEKVAFKEKMFEEIKKKMAASAPLVFLKYCINANLLGAKKPECFFMNLIIESLEGIVLEKILLRNFDEEEPVEKKKPKKKKNKGALNGGLEEKSNAAKNGGKMNLLASIFDQPPLKVSGYEQNKPADISVEEQKTNIVVEDRHLVQFPILDKSALNEAIETRLNQISQNGAKKRKKKSSTKPPQTTDEADVETTNLEPVSEGNEEVQSKPALVVVAVPQNNIQRKSKSRKKGRKRVPLVELQTKDQKFKIDEIMSGKLRADSEPVKLDSNVSKEKEVQELRQKIQALDENFADLKKPLLPDESTDSGHKGPKVLPDLPLQKNLLPNLYQKPLDEEVTIPRNASRKGSLSVDLLQAARAQQSASRSPGMKPSQHPKLMAAKSTAIQPKTSNFDSRPVGSEEFEQDTQKSQKHSSNEDDRVRAQSKPDYRETVTQDGSLYGMRETQSQTDNQSVNYHNQTSTKSAKKKPKLRKVVKEAGPRKDRNMPSSSNNQYQQQSPNTGLAIHTKPQPFPQRDQRNTKEDYRNSEHNAPLANSNSVRVGVPEKEPRDSWDPRGSAAAKDQKQIPLKKAKEPEKVSKLQKGTNLKAKRPEPIKKPAASMRWEDTPEPIKFDQNPMNSGMKTDLKMTKNFSTTDGQISKIRSYYNNCRSQSPDKNIDSENEVGMHRRPTDESGSTNGDIVYYDGETSRQLKMTNTPPPPSQKVNKFLTQKHKLTHDYHPTAQPIFPNFYREMCQNRYSLEDPKRSALTAQIQAATLSLCKNKEFYINDKECPPRTTKVINETLNRITKQLDSDLRLIFNGLDQFNQSMLQPRQMIMERIANIVERSFNGTLKVKAYGSFETGLLTPFSDLDLAITGAIIENTNEQTKSMLRLVRDNLTLYDFVINCNLIESATVPVIKLEADASQPYEQFPTLPNPVKVKVDLIVETPEPFNAITTAMRTTEYMRNCQHWYKSFLPNVLCLKYIANFNQLTNTYCGKLNRRNQLARFGTALQRLSGGKLLGRS